MKNLFKLSLSLSIVIVATVLFTSIPKESNAADVIALAFHMETVTCSDGTVVDRCRDGGSSCNVSAQQLCNYDR